MEQTSSTLEPQRIAESLGRLLGYLRSWQNPDGLFGGMIATWWSSTLETAVPHPMNQFPMILGFLELHRGKVGGGDWLAEARRVGDGLVDSIGPDGMLRNCWADIPGMKTGSVIFTAPALALSELYRTTQDSTYLRGATTLQDTINRYWVLAGVDSYGVMNQGFKWAESLISLGKAVGDSRYIEQALWITRKYLDHQIHQGPMAGAFYQARTDDRLISVYEGKCIAPLLQCFEESSDRTFLDAALRLGTYLLSQRVESGIFLNYHEPYGAWYRLVWNALARLDYRVLRRRGRIYRIWRSVIRDWMTLPYPSFIARSADSLRGLWMLTKYAPELKTQVADLTRKLLGFQLPHGGFPNSVGYMGSDQKTDWQDICCPVRWNSYTFHLLSFLMAEMGHGIELMIPSYPETDFVRRVGKDGTQRYRESRELVEFYQGEELVARLAKPSGECLVIAPGWDGELTEWRGKENLEACANGTCRNYRV